MQRRRPLAPAPHLFPPEDVEPARDDDAGPGESEGVGQIAEKDITQHDRPDDDCVLIRNDHARRRERQGTVDAGKRHEREYAEQREKREVAHWSATGVFFSSYTIALTAWITGMILIANLLQRISK